MRFETENIRSDQKHELVPLSLKLTSSCHTSVFTNLEMIN